MKKKILVLIVPIIFLGESCWFPWWDKCDDAFELSDLVVNKVEQYTTSEDNEKVYNILHSVLNSAKDITCPEAVGVADSHKDKVPIEYSADGNFDSNGVEVQTKVVQAGSVPSGKTYDLLSKIIFAVDGAYRIIADIDIDDNVKERDENNNQSVDAITEKKSSLTYSKGSIIYVTNTGRNKPEQDKNGNPIYIKKWEIKVIQ